MALTRTTSTFRLTCLLGASALAACSNTMVFSDTAALVVTGHPPPPPPPPPPPEPPPPPPPAPKRVEVQQDQIVIREKIQFQTDQAVIKPESFDLMNEIAGVVNANPQLKKLSIEGHTDSVGSDKHNLKLSDKRAAAVLKYLVDHGVATERLVSKGWGETKPLGDNATEEGREQNRRVEFVIVQQDTVERTYEIDPKTGERRLVPTPPTAAPTNAAAPAPATPGGTP